MIKEFKHRKLSERIKENNGDVEIIQYDWVDLLTVSYFCNNEFIKAIQETERRREIEKNN